MTKNEIVARWLYESCTDPNHKDDPCFSVDNRYRKASELIMDYNTLHKAWVKFRDLQSTDGDGGMHEHYKSRIAYAIVNLPITETFDELVKGIEWYNSLKK